MIRIKRHLLTLSALILTVGVSANSLATENTKTNRDHWATHNPAEAHVPDHKFLTTFLQAYGRTARSKTVFNYVAMKGQGVKYLEAYTNYLVSIPVSKLNRDEQLAYWLNLYNAGVLHAVASAKRTPRNMAKHRGTPGAPGQMWGADRFTIEGHEISLEDIEMNILTRHWPGKSGTDPMWIYGLNYAARGSPSRPLLAFYGNTVHEQLKDSAEAFLKRPSSIKIRKGKLEVSRLYDWHQASFGSDEAAVIEHLKSFTNAKARAKLEPIKEISGYSFGWRTNGFSKKSSAPSVGGDTGEQSMGGMEGY